MHFTRFVSLVIFVTPLVSQAALAAGFVDITTSHPGHDAISYVHQEGIVSGYPDNSYQPDRFINRVEFVKIVVGATFTPQAWDRCDPNHIYFFNDAGRDEWYSPYLCVAVQNKVIEGYSNGSFMPSLGINFVEAAKILVTADRIDQGGNLRYDRTLPEAEGEWYAPYVQYLSARKAIPIGISRLDQNVTRGDMAEMIYRLRAGITDKPSRTYEELSFVKIP